MGRERVFKTIEDTAKIYQGGMMIPPKFLPSYIDWLWGNSQHIIESFTTTGVIYTVPDDFTFFLTSIYVTTGKTGVTVSAGAFTSLNGQKNIISVKGWENASASLSFPNPLKFNSGVVFETYKDAGAVIGAGISGFLVKNSDLVEI